MRLERVGSALPWKRLLAELTVIVAGVLIALAVDSWWERRQERSHARQYLEQLLVHFETTERRLRSTIETETQRLEAVTTVIDRALRGPGRTQTRLTYRPATTGTLTALIEGGDLRLLRSDSVRFELIAFSHCFTRPKRFCGTPKP